MYTTELNKNVKPIETAEDPELVAAFDARGSTLTFDDDVKIVSIDHEINSRYLDDVRRRLRHQLFVARVNRGITA